MFSALFVFYFNYNVGVLRTICFILSLKCWCFARYLFSTFTNALLFCALFVFFYYNAGVLRTISFLLLLLLWCFAHYLFSLTITLVFCALYVSTIMLVCCAPFVFYFHYYVGVLRTVCFLLSLTRWCFAHYPFSAFTITLVCCALFVFYFR